MNHKKQKPSLDKIRNIVVIGDTHCGSQAAIMPPGFCLRDGQPVGLSPRQEQLWNWWNEFWDKFVPHVTKGEPYIIVHNGDIVDGAHHGCTQLITSNVDKQREMAVKLLAPRVGNAKALYCIAGTAAHAGQSNADEEGCARELGAVKDANGNFTRQDLWIEMGDALIQFAHHIGTTSSAAYKSSPAMRTMAAMFTAAGEHGFRPPSMMIRSHAHDYVEVKRANCRVTVCPAWQLKSDWMWGKDTTSLPIIGGLVVRQGEDDVHIREFVRTPKPSSHVRL